jgi:serine/threonine protein phosphatase 1
MILRRAVGSPAIGPDAPIPRGGIPEGERVYAVGDVHGRADLLDELRELVAADCNERPPGSATAVFLGDYVDRGPDSRAVLDILTSETFPTPTVFLTGNHEAMMLDFLRDGGRGSGWLPNGGIDTLQSYRIELGDLRTARGLEAASQRLREVLPESHRAFLQGLRLTHEVGGYFFCHAGVRPGVPLDRQDVQDLLWIRQEFLSSTEPFGKIVVHGHTPVREPEVRPNRINVDTGAFVSGRLTCLVLEGTTHRFLVAGAGGAVRRQAVF